MKTIPLTQGYITVVDDDVYEWAKKFNWCVMRRNQLRHVMAHGKATKGGRKTLYLHRIISGAKSGEIVDHVNGDGLDNRKSNLRICTRRQNTLNQRKHVEASSQFKGVTLRKDKNLWQAYITVSGKRKHLKYWLNEIDAAKAYDAAAKKYFGEFASLNFR